MSDGTEITPFEPTAISADVVGYKRTRLALSTLLESYTSDKGQALELMERWENGVWACVHLNQPTAAAANEAFSVAAQGFLRDIVK